MFGYTKLFHFPLGGCGLVEVAFGCFLLFMLCNVDQVFWCCVFGSEYFDVVPVV